jgi:hypothetical protein
MIPISLTSRISRSPNVSYRDLEDGGVLLHLQTGAYHGLNGTGAAIWKLIEDEPTFGDVLTGLERQLETVPQGLQADVARFVQDLQQRSLLNVKEG